MSDLCHWASDTEIGKFFLPGCMGGAVYGPNGCTCLKPPRGRPSLEARLVTLEAKVDRLLRGERPPP